MPDTYGLVDVLEKQIPTVVFYNQLDEQYVIGDKAKENGVKGYTTAFNFKQSLGAGQKELHTTRYWIAPTGVYDLNNVKVLSAYELAKIYIKKAVDQLGLPGKMIVGVPAIPKRTWVENYRATIRKIFSELELESPLFFYEPFAVYNAYRKNPDFVDRLLSSEDVLVLDLGGSTFDCCLIRSNDSGEISKSGTRSAPLGVVSSFDGGIEIDKKILSVLIAKLKQKGIVWKEDPEKRALSGRNPVLLCIEEGKISLCKKIGNRRLTTDVSTISHRFNFPEGWLHQDLSLSEVLTGEELKEIIRFFWEKHWIEAVKKVKEEAASLLSMRSSERSRPLQLSRVIIAGGSSQLPYFEELVIKSFAHEVKSNSILRQGRVESTVAYGLAYECKVQAERDPALVKDALAPCLMSDLYFGVREEKRGRIYPVKILGGESANTEGRLGSRPLLLNSYLAEFDIEFPFSPSKNLYYGFYSEPVIEDGDNHVLNVGQDVAKINDIGRINKRAKLKLTFSPDGVVRISLGLKGKGRRAKDGLHFLDLPSFEFTNIDMHEGQVFFGFDFGNSNSYLVQLHAQKKNEQQIVEYPFFSLERHIKRKLVATDKKVSERLGKGRSKDNVIRYARYISLDHVYHSNKLEKSPLSFEKSRSAIIKEKGLTKFEKEAKNLSNAYEWMVDNAHALYDAPEIFIKHINGLLLDGVSDGAGSYRKKMVEISGAQITPPQVAIVPGMMQQLAEEIKSDTLNRSPLEFAVAIHTKFVFIHPFLDGNGRTARLLMNAILITQNYLPLVVDSQSRTRYLSGLDVAASGDFSMLVRFLIDETRTSLSKFDKYISENSQRNACRDHDLLLQKEKIKVKDAKRIDVVNPIEYVFKSVLPFLRYSANIFCAKHRGVNFEIEEYGFPDREFFLSKSSLWTSEIQWYFTIEISYKARKERFLFYFEKVEVLRSQQQLGNATVTIARWVCSDFEDLSVEPITIRDVNASPDGVELIPGPVPLTLESFESFFEEIYKYYLL